MNDAVGPPARLNWLQLVVNLSLLAMEAFWLSAWVPLLDPLIELRSRQHSVLGVFAVLLIAFVGGWLVRSLRLPTLARYALVLILMLLSTMGIIWYELYAGYPLFSLRWVGRMLMSLGSVRQRLPAEVTLILMSLYAWYQGPALIDAGPVTDLAGSRFRRGFMALVLYTFLALLGNLGVPGEVYGFFFVGMVALASARLLESDVRLDDWDLARRWLGFLFAAALLTLIVGLAIVSLISAGDFVVARQALSVLYEVGSYILLYWISLLSYVLGPVLEWLMEAIPALLRDAPVPEMPGPALYLAPGGGAPSERTPVQLAWDVLQQVVAWGVLVGVLIWIVRGVGRRLRRRAAGGGVERESLQAPALDRRELREAWRQVVARVRHLGPGPRYSARTIRQIYASLLAYAGELGHPRDDAETPSEYLPTLEQIFPKTEAEVGLITAAYVRVHYGQVPETAQDLGRVRASWNRVLDFGPVDNRRQGGSRAPRPRPSGSPRE